MTIADGQIDRLQVVPEATGLLHHTTRHRDKTDSGRATSIDAAARKRGQAELLTERGRGDLLVPRKRIAGDAHAVCPGIRTLR
jgi:hypothetical protein